MPMPQDIDARRYYRVALQRMDDGELILERLKRPTAAVYLAGYAAECILKSLLVASTPSQQRPKTIAKFIGNRGHDLEWLRALLRTHGVTMPAQVSRDFAFISTWSTNLRYEATPGNERTADRFIRSTKAVLQWAIGRF
ncbi:MAG: HEPN domain-containing protein [Planctomycetes bacterium]|nr:HEPN domain-containing protein [Planctomycetota bacterium]